MALILDAWTLGADGRLDAGGSTHFTVNGLPSLDIPVTSNERVRLRLLNASRDRLLTVRLDRHAATVMAIDGQPAEPFPARDSRVALGPGNRLDLFVDAALAPESIAPIFVGLDDREAPLARLVYGSAPPARPAPRAGIKAAAGQSAAPAHEFRGRGQARASRWMIRDIGRRRAVLAARCSRRRRARRVTMRIRTRPTTAHAVHLHGHHARLLDALDDGWKPFWLDTILAPPQRTTRIAFVADNRGKWLIESQALRGDSGIGTWFEVT